MDTETHCEYYDTVRASYNLVEFLCSTPDTSLIIFCDKVNNFFLPLDELFLTSVSGNVAK
jgi:hypothetical protein